MNRVTRRLLYMSIMPLVYFFNVIINFAGINTTIPILIIMIMVMVFRFSDKGEHLQGMNEWIKEKTVFFFSDIYETGIMPNSRTLRVCIPCIVAVFTNIGIEKLI